MAKDAANFLQYGEWLMGRLRWAAEGAGQAASGFIGILTDLATEGLHQAFYARLPGHPQQAVDSLDVLGSDRDLIKYSASTVDFIGEPSESQAFWKTRVQRAWVDYEQGGTPQVVLRGVEDWGKETFGSLDGSGLVGTPSHDASVTADVNNLLLAPGVEGELVLHCDGSPGRLIFLNINCGANPEVEPLGFGWNLAAENTTVSGTGNPYNHKLWWKIVGPYESFRSVNVRCKNLSTVGNTRFIGRALNVSGQYAGNPIVEIVKATGDGTSISTPALTGQGSSLLSIAFIGSRLTTYAPITPGGWTEIEEERTAGATGIGIDEQFNLCHATAGIPTGTLSLGATGAVSLIFLTIKQQPQYSYRVDEYQWARFIVEIDNTPWGPAISYGGGAVYGDGSVYGLDANTHDVTGLKKTILKWKPKRSKAYIKVQTEILDVTFDPPEYDADVGTDTNHLVLPDGVNTTGTLLLNCDGSPGNLLFLHLGCERGGNRFTILMDGWHQVASQTASGTNGPYHHEVWLKIVPETESFTQVAVFCEYASGSGADDFLGRCLLLPGSYSGITNPVVQQANTTGNGTAAIPGPVLTNLSYKTMALSFIAGRAKPNYTPYTGPGATSWTELGELSNGFALQHQYKEISGSDTSASAETTWGDGVTNTWGRIGIKVRQTASVTFSVGELNAS